MVVYNVTVKIDNAAKEDWLRWMREDHIPKVMATGAFLSYRLNRVLSLEDTDGTTFAIQYLCADMSTLHHYQVHQAPTLQKEHAERYKDQFVAFRTVLEVLEEGVGANSARN